MVKSRRVFKILTGKPAAKRPIGSPRLRLEDNSRIDLQKIFDNTNWIFRLMIWISGELL